LFPHGKRQVSASSFTTRLTPSVPGIVLSSPIISGDLVQINFLIIYGWASSFELLEANALAGSWSVNTSAMLTVNAQEVSYTFTAPCLGGLLTSIACELISAQTSI